MQHSFNGPVAVGSSAMRASMAFDARAAWTGTFAADRSEPVRVEAAAWEGRPVHFSVASADGHVADPVTPSAGSRGVPPDPDRADSSELSVEKRERAPARCLARAATCPP
jgi:hypothetical protein